MTEKERDAAWDAFENPPAPVAEMDWSSLKKVKVAAAEVVS